MPLVVVAAADVAIATKVGMREDALMGAADSLSLSLSQRARRETTATYVCYTGSSSHERVVVRKHSHTRATHLAVYVPTPKTSKNHTWPKAAPKVPYWAPTTPAAPP